MLTGTLQNTGEKKKKIKIEKKKKKYGKKKRKKIKIENVASCENSPNLNKSNT